MIFPTRVTPVRAPPSRSAKTVPYDETGRCVLPPMMRELGEIAGRALFLGTGDTFEIWNPDALLAQPGLDPRMARLVRAQLAAKA